MLDCRLTAKKAAIQILREHKNTAPKPIDAVITMAQQVGVETSPRDIIVGGVQ